MKLKIVFTMVYGVLFLFLSPHSGYADVINLKNGDKLTGTVLSLSKGMLNFSTSYSKKIEIKKAEINSLETDQSVKVQLKNGWKIKGKLRPTAEGQYSIRTKSSNQRATIDFMEITKKNLGLGKGKSMQEVPINQET
jgi:hypothetical protein